LVFIALRKKMNNQFQILRDNERLVDQDSHGFSTTYFGQLFKEEAYYWPLTEGPTKIVEAEEGIEVLFLCSEFNSGEENPERVILEKMATAMKLRPGEYEVRDFSNNSLENEQNILKSEVKALIKDLRPKVVVTFGAAMTNFILDKQERLSKIHGKFFPNIFEGHQVQIVPVFHPGFLIINPNMKRSAWVDLQKVMDFIGKS